MSTGDWERLEKLDEKAAKAHKMKLFPENTVVFAKSGMSAALARVFKTDRPAYIVSHLAALKPNGRADPNFLAHWLEHYGTDKLIKDPAYPSIRLSDIEKMPFPKLPLPEQRRIAGILDQARRLRRLRRQSLRHLSDLDHAIFYEMFGDLVTNPNWWPEKTFRDLATRITVGIVVKPASYYREVGVPALRGTNIKFEGIDLSDAVYISEQDNERVLSKTRVWTDDLVIVRSGRPGLAALVPPELSGINSIDVLILSPDKEVVAPRFLKDLINSPMGKRLILSESRGQVQQHFNVGSLSKAKLFLPPYDLQLEYLSQISAFDEAAARRNESEEMLETLFAALEHRAFRGEL